MAVTHSTHKLKISILLKIMDSPYWGMHNKIYA